MMKRRTFLAGAAALPVVAALPAASAVAAPVQSGGLATIAAALPVGTDGMVLNYALQWEMTYLMQYFIGVNAEGTDE